MAKGRLCSTHPVGPGGAACGGAVCRSSQPEGGLARAVEAVEQCPEAAHTALVVSQIAGAAAAGAGALAGDVAGAVHVHVAATTLEREGRGRLAQSRRRWMSQRKMRRVGCCLRSSEAMEQMDEPETDRECRVLLVLIRSHGTQCPSRSRLRDCSGYCDFCNHG